MPTTPTREPPGGAGDHDRAFEATSSAQLVLIDSISEASRVRSCLRSLLVAYGDAVVVDSLLIADELATDAFEFGQPPRVVRLRITDGGDCLRIEVDSLDVPAHIPPPRTGNLGRLLLEFLTRTWGVYRHGRHKTTWAELDLAA